MAPWIRDAFDWLKGLGAKIAHLLSPAVSVLEQAFKANEGKIEGDIISFVEGAATQAVAAAATNGGTPDEKAAFALSSFLSTITSKGMAFGTNEAKLLLENAYANWKASQVATPIPAPEVSNATGVAS